jgi:N-acetylmuramoyl-L-alanine amidase
VTDAEVRAALSPSQTLAVTLYGEGRGEPIEGRIAVASVIRNRVKAGTFGDGYKGVCLKRWQFSCWNEPIGTGAANYIATMLAARSLVSPSEPLANVLKECVWIAEGIALGVVLDRVKGADHYYSPKAMIPKGATPTWSQGKPIVAVVGSHLFFRLRDD